MYLAIENEVSVEKTRTFIPLYIFNRMNVKLKKNTTKLLDIKKLIEHSTSPMI